MKRFIRTLVGKTTLFIVCIVSFCIFAAGVVGIILYTQNDLAFYRLSEQELIRDFLVNDRLRPVSFSLLWNRLSGTPETRDGYEYRILDGNGGVLAESECCDALDAAAYTFTYRVLRDAEGNLNAIVYLYTDQPNDENAEYYTVHLSVIEGSRAANEFSFFSSAIRAAYALRYAIYFIVLASLLLAAVCFIALMYAAGRRPDTDVLVPGPLHRLPYDVLLVLCGAIGFGLFYVGDALTGGDLDGPFELCVLIGTCLIGLNMPLGLCMSTAVRLKQHTLLKNTLLCRALKLLWRMLCCLWRLLCAIPTVWKTAVVFCGIALTELFVVIGLGGDCTAVGALWLLEKVLLFPAVVYLALMLRRLRSSGIALASGDLSYHTDTKGMIGELRQHGDDLNSIAVGMAIAVEDRLKSERMKTELITNVSHDLKTPLTSIINYAALIGGEPCDDPKITEYAEVLVRQSEKLKRLIEDLVEASKASTGNLEVNLAPCDAAVFITQAAGEYEEKLQKSELTLLTKLPEKELRIMADGRRMWRIFDNLMNNVCKYAQPGTRVYLTLEEQNGSAVFSFKNTSREPLNMSEKDLLERFTRGDSSRSTDGNGLGLSIAVSMAELQGGSLRLVTDGDLFKAILTFPKI